MSVRTTLVLAGLTALSGATVLGTASEASSVDPFRGTLAGTTGALGEVTLSRNTTIEVTSSSFIGKRTVTLALRRGHWAYRGVVGRIHEFTVVA